MTTNSATSEAARPSLIELAVTFNYIALASFGGGLSAWSREIVVVRKNWMHDEEFLSAVTMCRILPGANQVNLAVFVGTKFHGVPGALAAVCGLCALPVAIAMGLAYAYFRFHQVPEVDSILRGATSAAIALTLAMAVKTGKKCLTGILPIVLCSAIFLLNGVLRWPLLASLALTAPPALLWAWMKSRR